MESELLSLTLLSNTAFINADVDAGAAGRGYVIAVDRAAARGVVEEVTVVTGVGIEFFVAVAP